MVLRLFFAISSITIVLQIAKYYILKSEVKKRNDRLPCDYYKMGKKLVKTCINPDWADEFRKRGNSCKGCKGKTVDQDIGKMEQRLLYYEPTKRGFIIMFANLLQSIMPALGVLCALINLLRRGG